MNIGGGGVLYKHEVCVGEETERGMKKCTRAIEETGVELLNLVNDLSSDIPRGPNSK